VSETASFITLVSCVQGFIKSMTTRVLSADLDWWLFGVGVVISVCMA